MRVYTDAARGDEVVGLGWIIVLEDGTQIEDSRYLRGDYTSMEAEYFALLDGIRMANRQEGNTIEVFSDCKPLIKKMEIPDNNNEDWYNRRTGCLRLLTKFDEWEIGWTPRTHNVNADRLAYEALEDGRKL